MRATHFFIFIILYFFIFIHIVFIMAFMMGVCVHLQEFLYLGKLCPISKIILFISLINFSFYFACLQLAWL